MKNNKELRNTGRNKMVGKCHKINLLQEVKMNGYKYKLRERRNGRHLEEERITDDRAGSDY